MGTAISTDIQNLATSKITNVDLDATVTDIGTTPTVFAFEADNSANTVDVYVMMWNVASVTVGSTAEWVIRRIPAGKKLYYLLAGGDGYNFNADCKVACSTAVASASAPTNNVPVTFWTDGG